MAHTIKILKIEKLTHDVKRFTTEKPEGYSFTPGQATEVAINKEDYRDKKRPFTFTSLPEDDHLEFTIKSYHDHDGVTKKIDSLEEGKEFIIDDAWGAIEYKGKGTFIAGGAGVTPFIAILRDLRAKDELDGNRLLFSNKEIKDVIMQAEFEQMLGEDFISTLTRDRSKGHKHGRINQGFLKDYVRSFSEHFYVCGPDQMVKDINEQLQDLGADSDSLVFEK
ncbi:MAG TPA: FAD-binding oxidoreductase [Saprospiraceae bacterium]|nr:FAD-binding oxidoreductase [Saprospiraceae bacterium]